MGRLILSLVAMVLATPVAGAECVRAIDGDTILVSGEKIRVMGVDTPELHARCPAELEAAIAAHIFTQAALDRGPVLLQRTRRDKYGRTLAVVWIADRDLAALLIEAGHGRPYYGERRRPWC
jgi:endonuclease YncB( thermonuclease family)